MGRRLAVLVVVLAGAATLGACTTSTDRASGITERWLQAVGDLGRDNLRDHALDRIADLGDPALVDEVLPAPQQRPDDERHFEDLEVGKATTGAGDRARVPFRVSARTLDDETIEIRATAVLEPDGRSWRVVAIAEQAATERVPSDGGERPARATGRQWVTALVIGLAILAGSIVLIEAQPAPRRAG